jgi:hypothetical protein
VAGFLEFEISASNEIAADLSAPAAAACRLRAANAAANMNWITKAKAGACAAVDGAEASVSG